MSRWRGMWIVAAAGLPLPGAAEPPKVPRDAPFCAVPGTKPLFLSPMGEPFRAAAGQPYPAAAWIARADADRDGGVDRAEFVADARRFFRTLDTDHDGRLEPEEVIAYERDVAPEIALYAARPQEARRGRDDRRGYGGPMGAGRFAWLNVPEPVAAADLDVDRVVTEAEFAAAASRRFDALDAKGAGTLRLADLARTPEQIAIEGPCRPRPRPRGRPSEQEER